MSHTNVTHDSATTFPAPKRPRGVYFSWSPSCSSLGRKRTSLLTGLLSVVSRVLTMTDLTRPCASGSTRTTSAYGQALRGTFSSRIITTSPSTRLPWGCCHMCLSCITTSYSFFHRDQNRFAKYCTLRHQQRMYTSFFWNYPGGGNNTVDLAVRIWLGVSGSRSSGSPDTVVKGLELITASTSHMRVRNDSSSKQWPYSSMRPASIILLVLICLP